MAQTIIGKAIELIEELGYYEAIEFFELKIKTSDDWFKICGYNTAIDYIRKEKFKHEQEVLNNVFGEGTM